MKAAVYSRNRVPDVAAGLSVFSFLFGRNNKRPIGQVLLQKEDRAL